MLRTLIFTIIASVFLTSCALESTEPVLDRSLTTLPFGTEANFHEFGIKKQLTVTATDGHYLISKNGETKGEALFFYDAKTLGPEFSSLQSYGVNYIVEYVIENSGSHYLMAHATDESLFVINPVPNDQAVDEINEIKANTITKKPGKNEGYLITSKEGLATALNVIIRYVDRERMSYYIKVID